MSSPKSLIGPDTGLTLALVELLETLLDFDVVDAGDLEFSPLLNLLIPLAFEDDLPDFVDLTTREEEGDVEERAFEFVPECLPIGGDVAVCFDVDEDLEEEDNFPLPPFILPAVLHVSLLSLLPGKADEPGPTEEPEEVERSPPVTDDDDDDVLVCKLLPGVWKKINTNTHVHDKNIIIKNNK